MLNKIHNENCLETMSRMDGGLVDLVVTSPPYDNLRSYKGGVGSDWNFEVFKPIAKELFRVVKDGGVVVWVVGDATINGSETGTSFKQALYFMECGFNLHDTMIYHKSGCTFPEEVRYYPGFEYMFVLSKGKPYAINLIADRKNKYAGGIIKGRSRQVNGDLTRRSGDGQQIKNKAVRQNIWTYGTGWMVTSSDLITFEHGAAFPEKLARDHIYTWSNEGNLVYDPFGGSGTTAKMAHLQRRNWILSEISEEYCELAKKRIDPHLRQTRLLL